MTAPRQKKSRSIEFVSKALACSGVTPQKAEIKLGLLDDEMAQILQIDSTIQQDNAHAAPMSMFLSLDPDSDENPQSDTDLEHLEVFYQHREGDVSNASAAVTAYAAHKIETFDPPINVGTNIGMTVNSGVALNVSKATVTIYFRRAKASDIELAKILLKRR